MILIYILLLIVHILTVELPKYLTQPSKDKYFVGDNYISDKNFSSVILREQKITAILFTLKYCTSCYKNQQSIKNIMQLFKSKHIEVYRSQLAQNPQLQNKFKITRFPYLILFEKDKPIFYRGLFEYNRVNLFLNQYYSPLTIIQAQLNQSQIHNLIFQGRAHHQSLIIFFVYDLQEFQHQIKIFINLSRDKQDLQTDFMIIKNKNTIKLWKKLYPQWFPTHRLSTIANVRFLLKSYYYQIVNLDEITQNFIAQIRKCFLIGVKEFLPVYYEIADKRKQIVVCVIDSISQLQKSNQILSMLQQILQIYHSKIYVFWVQGAINIQKKKILGLSANDNPPSIAFFRPLSLDKIIFPSNQTFTKQNIIKFIDSHVIQTQYVKQPLQQKLKRIGSNNIKIQTNKNLNYSEAVVFCVDDLDEEQIQALQYIKSRIFRFLYKTIKVVLLEKNFSLSKQQFNKGVYLIINSTVTKIVYKINCEYILSQLSKVRQLPDYPCIQQHQMREYFISLRNKY